METYKDGEPSENDIGDDGDANVKLEGYRDIRAPADERGVPMVESSEMAQTVESM